MILIALALQAAPPAFMTDPAFNAAYLAWAGCTNRAVDAAAGSDRREREIVAAAHAACTAEEAATRAAMIAAMGEARGPREMDRLRAADRNALAERVRERRARGRGASAAPEVLIRAWVQCLLRRTEATAADAPEAQALDSAFAGCAAEEDALRRYAQAEVGAERTDEFIRLSRESNRDHLRAHLRERRGQASPPG